MKTSRHTRGWDGERYTGTTLGTLHCCSWDVDGDVKLKLAFDDLNDVARMDLLMDWIGLLDRERQILFKEMYGEDEDAPPAPFQPFNDGASDITGNNE